MTGARRWRWFAVEAAGFVVVAVGLAMIWIPLGLLTAGAVLITVANRELHRDAQGPGREVTNR